MIPTENKNTIHFKQRLMPNCLPHDLEIVTMNGGESTSQYHTPLAAAQFTGKQKKNYIQLFYRHTTYTHVTTVTDKLDNQDMLRYCNIQVCHKTSQYNTAKVTVIH